MTRFLKILLLWFVVGAMVWLFTLWHWQQTARDVDLFDIVAYLLGLPTALVLGWVVMLWGLKKLRERAGRTPQTGALSGSADSPLAATSDADLRQAHTVVLGAAVHTRAGADALSTWTELLSGGTRPDLDSHLQDLDGLPVFSARVPELEVDSDSDAAESTEAGPGMAARRAWALLQAPCDQLAETWLSVAEQVGSQPSADDVSASPFVWDDGGKAHLSGVAHKGSRGDRAEISPVQWSVRVLMPAAWPVADQDWLVVSLRGRLANLIEQLESQGIAAPQWLVIPPETPEHWWIEYDDHVRRWARGGQAEAMLILAVDSALDEDTVERWQSIGELFTSQHQVGRIPGEAAAGLLLASSALAARMDVAKLDVPPLRLSRPVHLRRDKSADALGRVGAAVLSDAMSQVMGVSQLVASPALTIVADADHRASRTSELFEALQAVAPELDPMHNVARAGEALGDVGVARSLLPAALSCAAVWSSEGEGYALAAHVQSSHDRVVLAVSAMPAVNAVAA